MARALTVAVGLSGLGALAGAAVQEATACSKAGDCAAEPDASGLLQVRREEGLGAAYKLQSLSGWTGVDQELGLSSAVTAVQNQGNCGSCAAFSGVEQLGLRLAKAGKTVNGILSVQATLWGGQQWGYGEGCNGGLPSSYGDMYGQYGIPDETCAPYKAGKKCVPDSNGADNGCFEMTWGSCYGSGSWLKYGFGLSSRRIAGEDDMMSEIYNNGPISACLYVFENFFSMSGPLEKDVYTHTEGSLAGGHAIVLTGWGNTPDSSGTPIWKLKNSWGEGWGDHGYIFILRGADLAYLESWDVAAFEVTNAQAGLLEAGNEQSSQSRAAPASPAQEDVEGLLPGGWYEQQVDSGMAKQVIDAYERISGNSQAVLKVHTRVAAGVHAKIALHVPEGDKGSGAAGHVVHLLKPIEAFLAGRSAGETNGWAMA